MILKQLLKKRDPFLQMNDAILDKIEGKDRRKNERELDVDEVEQDYLEKEDSFKQAGKFHEEQYYNSVAEKNG